MYKWNNNVLNIIGGDRNANAQNRNAQNDLLFAGSSERRPGINISVKTGGGNNYGSGDNPNFHKTIRKMLEFAMKIG